MKLTAKQDSAVRQAVVLLTESRQKAGEIAPIIRKAFGVNVDTSKVRAKVRFSIATARGIQVEEDGSLKGASKDTAKKAVYDDAAYIVKLAYPSENGNGNGGSRKFDAATKAKGIMSSKPTKKQLESLIEMLKKELAKL